MNPLLLKKNWKGSKNLNQESELCGTITLFAKEFGYTPKEIWDMPIPTFMVMLDEWNKQMEREKKDMDRAKSKMRVRRR